MKKTVIALAIFCATITSVSAASIKWSIGGALDSAANIDTSVGSFVLAYIGKTTGVGVDAATFTEGVGSSYTIVDTGTWDDFFMSRRSTYSNTKTYTSTSDSTGDTYQAFYSLNGNYFLVNDPTIATVAVAVDGAGAASTTAYLNGTAQSGGNLFAAGGSNTAISSVPEPSTAALALAGLALLLKRRKA